MTMAGQSVPVLLVPIRCGLLVLPSVVVCEVVPSQGIFPVPGTRDWVLGYFVWRGVPVSVVSLERLMDQTDSAPGVHKLVVLYPLPGRDPHDYFAIASCAEPRTMTVGFDAKPAPSTTLPPRYVSSILDLEEGKGFIPDLQALKETFYPSSGPSTDQAGA